MIQQELLLLDVKGESFAINITDVQEIRVLSGLRPLPESPPHWLGVIEFREQIVPVIDLRVVMRAQDPYVGEKTVVVVVQVNAETCPAQLLGVVVDAVSNVISVDKKLLQSPPSLPGAPPSMLLGMFKYEGKIILKLSLEALFSAQDLDVLHSHLSISALKE